MEQLGFLDNVNGTKEDVFYENIVKILKGADNGDDVLTSFKNNKNYTTISFGENIVCLKIKFGKNLSFFAVSPRFKKILQKNNILYTVERSTMWLRVKINKPSDIFMYHQLILDLYNFCLELNSGVSFDCCSRYMQCSDVLKCVNPYPEVYKYCKYKTKLKNGIIFYGKNRNIQN